MVKNAPIVAEKKGTSAELQELESLLSLTL